MANFTMKNPTKSTPEEFSKDKDGYIKNLREKLDHKEELTNEEKDNLFEALGLGGTTAYIASEDRSIDFSDCLSRYLYWGENGEKYDRVELLKMGYAPDKETVARFYSQFDYFYVVSIAEEWPEMYQHGKPLPKKAKDQIK